MRSRLSENGLYFKDLNSKLTDADEARFWEKVDVGGIDECWPWLGYTDPAGYGQFSFEGKKKRAHRIAVRFTRTDPTDKVVRHLCHNPSCVNPRHLKTGTQLENVQDMVRANRQAQGEGNGNSKLSAGQVREIRRSDRPPEELASNYPVTAGNIRKIRAGELWSHLS